MSTVEKQWKFFSPIHLQQHDNVIHSIHKSQQHSPISKTYSLLNTRKYHSSSQLADINHISISHSTVNLSLNEEEEWIINIITN